MHIAEPQTTAEAHALGAFLGACIGDAAGSVLEFQPHAPTSAQVEKALQMPGGGVFGLAPGQVTDDSELALCLAQGLVASESLPWAERVARRYSQWLASSPFDIGNTTREALSGPTQLEYQTLCRSEGYAAAMYQAAAKRNKASQANGSLMRAVPMGIWGAYFDPEELAGYALYESALTHPNPLCCQAVASYVLAIACLIRSGGDRMQAFQTAWNWAQAHADETVCQWLQDADRGADLAYGPQIGFVRIAFTHAFRHLLAGTDYVSAIQETLAGGGDTDTNACIVGGMIGAAEAYAALPTEMCEAVVTADTHSGRLRPEFLHPRHVPHLVKQLLSKSHMPEQQANLSFQQAS